MEKIKKSENSALAHFLKEIEKIPVLSREEELALARKYREEGDLEAAKKLVLSNLRFVVKIALEYRNYPFNLMDLIQEGNIGLMMAVKKYDPEKGYRLISYAVWWIRAFIHSYIMNNWSLVKIGTTKAQKKLFPKMSTLSKIQSEEDVKALARKLDVSEEDIIEMEMRLAHKDFSLDSTISYEDDERTYADIIEGDEPTHEEIAISNEEHELIKTGVRQAISVLNEREREIIEKRFLSDNPMSLRELGKEMKLSRERVRQIEKSALQKISNELRKGKIILPLPAGQENKETPSEN